jgi:hypothetical protein
VGKRRAIAIGTERVVQAEKRHRADFGECLLLEVEPPFMPDARSSLEARLSLLHIYFSDRLPGAIRRT